MSLKPTMRSPVMMTMSRLTTTWRSSRTWTTTGPIDVVVDESDDAIPADLELDPTGEAWEVIEFADDGDNQEEGAESATGEIRDSGRHADRQAAR